MCSKKIFIFIVLLSIQAFTATPDDNRVLNSLQLKVYDLNEQQTKLNSLIVSCKKYQNPSVTKTCTSSSWFGFQSDKIVDLQARADSLKIELEAAQKDYDKQKTRSNLGVSVDELHFKLEGEMLLLDIANIQTNLSSNKLDIKNIYSKLNDTLLGGYTEYIIQKILKEKNMSNICEQAQSCSVTKSTKNLIEELKAKLLTFEQWKLQQEATPAASAPAGASDEGAANQ